MREPISALGNHDSTQRASRDAAVRPARLPGVEGARGIAALSVLAFHVWLRGGGGLGAGGTILSYGWLGVPLFFVLSGLLLYRPFAQAIVPGSSLPSFRKYARARVLRIFPAYWLVLVCTVPFLDPRFADSARSWLTHGIEQVFLVQTWFSNDWTGLAPAWTLVIEITFYAVLPLIVVCCLMSARRAETPGGRAWAQVLTLTPLIPAAFVYQHFALLEDGRSHCPSTSTSSPSGCCSPSPSNLQRPDEGSVTAGSSALAGSWPSALPSSSSTPGLPQTVTRE